MPWSMIDPTSALVDGGGLMPGDVVLDMGSHNPLLVTGVSLMEAESVDEVWKSKANHEVFGIDADSDIYRTVFLPRGDGISIPSETHRFPAERLRRVPTESATDGRRVQKVVVRSVIAHMIADMRNTDRGGQAEVIEDQLRRMFSAGYADETIEVAEAIESEGFTSE